MRKCQVQNHIKQLSVHTQRPNQTRKRGKRENKSESERLRELKERKDEVEYGVH